MAQPDTFIHDDFHEDHIFADRRLDGAWRYVFFDFGDACIGHPFMQLVSQPRFASNRFGIVVDPVQDKLRENYLSHWQDFATPDTLQHAMTLALITGCCIRGADLGQCLRGIPGRNTGRFAARVPVAIGLLADADCR